MTTWTWSNSRHWVFYWLLLLSVNHTRADSTSDYAVQVSAAVQTSPPQITLSWPQDSSVIPTSYTVSRKAKQDSTWRVVATLSGAVTSYIDTAVAVGGTYEYQVDKDASSYHGYGYVFAGIQAPLVDSRGKVILIVDDTYGADLSTELTQLTQDLVGDGWEVLRHDVSRSDSPPNVKAVIKADYAMDVANTKAVFLFGHVPVPYSGNFGPDGHYPGHYGAWPADVFYADVNGSWPDTTINSVVAADPRNWNVPGDGKTDPSSLPGAATLAVGRVDLSNLPSFDRNEKELLRQYLNKDHGFRHGLITAERRGLIQDSFGPFYGEAFAASGWRNFAAFFGDSNIAAVPPGGWISSLANQTYLWAYACGGGTYTSVDGMGTTSDLATASPQAVFTMIFGSYLGDWDEPDNVMRALLATPSHVLTCSWDGRPHWFYHHMALGETIGFSAQVSQNNAGGGTYKPQAAGTRQVHVALLGDPTLRMHPVLPPGPVQSTLTPGSVQLTWSASADSVLGYHLYRSSSAAGPFSRLTQAPVAATTFTDTGVSPGSYTYQVRAVTLEETASGTYYNSSQASFSTPTDVPAPAVLTVTASDSNASTAGPDPGAFTITRSGWLGQDLTVNVQFSGTAVSGVDYRPLASTVTVPAGADSVTISVLPLSDSVYQDTSLVLTLQPGPDYSVGNAAAATLSIKDPQPPGVVSVIASDPEASVIGLDPASLTISRTGGGSGPLTVTLEIGGTAVNGTDYQAVNPSVTLPAGVDSVAIPVTPVANTRYGTKTVVVTVKASFAYTVAASSSATVGLANPRPVDTVSRPVVSIQASLLKAYSVGSVPGVFTVSRTGDLGSELVVKLATSGTAQNGVDYLAIPSRVVIPAGTASVGIQIKPLLARVGRNSGLVTVSIVPDSTCVLGLNSSATIQIIDSKTQL